LKSINVKTHWLRWTFKTLVMIVALMVTVYLMVYFGGTVFQSQQEILQFGESIDQLFWAFFCLRVVMYAALYWKSQFIFGWFINRQDIAAVDFSASTYRHMLLRILIVYEALFPFDLIGRLNAGGF